MKLQNKNDIMKIINILVIAKSNTKFYLFRILKKKTLFILLVCVISMLWTLAFLGMVFSIKVIGVVL